MTAKTKTAYLLVLFLSLGLIMEATAADLTAGLEDVVLLSQNGISDETILIFLETRWVSVSLTAEEILSLRTAGVSETVINYLLQRQSRVNATVADIRPTVVYAYPSYYYQSGYVGRSFYPYSWNFHHYPHHYQRQHHPVNSTLFGHTAGLAVTHQNSFTGGHNSIFTGTHSVAHRTVSHGAIGGGHQVGHNSGGGNHRVGHSSMGRSQRIGHSSIGRSHRAGHSSFRGGHRGGGGSHGGGHGGH